MCVIILLHNLFSVEDCQLPHLQCFFVVCLFLTILPFLSVHFSTVKHIQIIVRQSSRHSHLIYLKLQPIALPAPLLLASSNQHSAFCFYEYEYFKKNSSGITQYLYFCDVFISLKIVSQVSSVLQFVAFSPFQG